MRILTLDGAASALGAGLALLDGDLVLERWQDGRGAAVDLPLLLQDSLDAVGWTMASVSQVAVLVGPGSFTGLRAALALAHGLAAGGSARVIGVTVGEAMAVALGHGGWCVSQARRDRVFVERIAPDGSVMPPIGCGIDQLPEVAGLADNGQLVVAGDGGAAVIGSLRRRGVAAVAGPERPPAWAIAAAAVARACGRLSPRAALPLYVDQPEARLPTPP